MCIRWKKILVPKDRVITIINGIDADDDGYLSFEEIEATLKKYADKLKRSFRSRK